MPPRRRSLPSMAYSTVLFDLDHTLLDSDTSERLAYESTLAAVGVADAETHFPLYRSINRAMWAEVEAGRMKPDEVRVQRFERFNIEAGIDADPGPMAEHYVEGLGAFGELFPGAMSMLVRVGELATLGLVTNGISQVQRTRIARLGLQDLFSAIVVSSEVGVAKPAPEIFDIVLDALDNPSRDSVVMVGDSLSSDVAGAIASGIDACWYNPAGLDNHSASIPVHVTAGFGPIVDLVAR